MDECPRIPLCRLVTHAGVRGLRDDVVALKLLFSMRAISLRRDILLFRRG